MADKKTKGPPDIPIYGGIYITITRDSISFLFNDPHKMEKRSYSLICLLILCTGLWLIGSAVTAWLKIGPSTSWPQTSGKIIESKVAFIEI